MLTLGLLLARGIVSRNGWDIVWLSGSRVAVISPTGEYTEHSYLSYARQYLTAHGVNTQDGWE